MAVTTRSELPYSYSCWWESRRHRAWVTVWRLSIDRTAEHAQTVDEAELDLSTLA
ncbi:hypothetical protein [Micromonospora echinaurantiaca]|uniref:hypothetical protein n=1 Tax=Micromonospora echinaurantiaca TaxID=47857 RepID=UPI00341ABEDE